ncbi:MAG: hypothetical protein E7289_05520 [Lachnospiraceae bacterium]|nr:hypothetical protein [Lachnospiraceae bacterium]
MKIKRLLIIPDPKQIEKSVALAQKYGCGFEYNDFYIPQFLDDATVCEERIRTYKQQRDLPEYTTMHGAFFDVTIFSDDPKIFAVSDERVEQSFRIALSIGVKGIVFHTNFVPNFHAEYYHRNWIERNISYWREKLEKYRDINIYIENMFDMSYELLVKLAEGLSEYPNFGICLDYAHAHAFGDEHKIADWVNTLAPYVKHIHINDNDLEHDLHLGIGEGKIDWERFKEFYETYFPAASVLVEMKNLEAAEKSIQYLQML